MSVDNVLEQLVNEIDTKLQSKDKIDRNNLIKQYTEDDIETKLYDSFAGKYIRLQKAYLKEKKYLSHMEDPEIDYKEVGINTFWGAFIGSNAMFHIVTIAIGAAIGGVMTYYDEKTDANIKFKDLFWYSIAGGWLGSIFDPEGKDFYSIIGAGAGVGIAIFKEAKKIRRLTPQEKALKLQELEAQHPQDVQELIQTTKIEYFNEVKYKSH